MGYRDAMIHGETNVGLGMVGGDSEEDRLIEENRDLRNRLAQAERENEKLQHDIHQYVQIASDLVAERDEARGLLKRARPIVTWMLDTDPDAVGVVNDIDEHLRDT